ncbi:MAG: ISKra4 family transposase [Acidimicrobiia bacterium]|nr:ISKra4 family transposase [Acidimicrobiia bacterium]
MSCPTCHGPSKFQDRRDKTFVSLMGPIVLEDRAYYLCPACHAGHVPVDAALGFSARQLTPGAEEIATLAGTCDSFADAAEKLLPKMAGLRLSESTVERTTEAAGERLGALWDGGRTLGATAAWRWNRDARGRTVAYVSVDATGVGIQGECGAKADGRMIWVGKVFNPRVAPTEAFPKPHPGAARYQAGLMDLEELGARLRRQAAQVGMDRAEQWVALTDGGNGLDDFMEVFFPRAVRILDFYHAAEHLGDLAKAYCGGDAAAAEGLTEQWSHQLKHEGGEAILTTLEALDLNGRSAAVREEHRQVSGYVRNNRRRMDYPRYRAEGWQIGSGHIEAACKTVVNQRLKQSGMRWGSDGADAVCHLRALYESESGQWDALWERSIN